MQERKHIYRFWLLIFIIVSFVVVYQFTALSDFFSPESLVNTIHNAGMWAILIFITLMIFGAIINVPSPLFYVASGMAFGAYFGTMISVLGAVLASIIVFGFSRALGEEVVKKVLKEKFKRFHKILDNNGLEIILISRLTPFSPYNAVNYAAGVTNISFKDYFVGTLIGIIPKVFAFNYLSSPYTVYWSGEFFMMSFVFLLVLFYWPAHYWRKEKRKKLV
ncbi:TVP38/TMEM64 family protein [Candidatus Woesearchaeota archaeon]|nr:TVP38/TMEM64 family protein [Candidatus Woesearchaeota archaeon]